MRIELLDPVIARVQDIIISGRIPDDVVGIIERKILFGLEPADRSDEFQFYFWVGAPFPAPLIVDDTDAIHRLDFLCSDEDRNEE